MYTKSLVAHMALFGSAVLFQFLPAATLWNEESVDSSPSAGLYNDLKVASDGTIHVAYQDGASLDMRYAKRSPAGTWSLQTIESLDDSGSFCTMALTASGTPNVTYFKNYQIGFPPFTQDLWKLQHGIWNGSSWTITTPKTGQGDGQHAALALDITGQPLIGYYSYSTTHEARFIRWNGASGNDELLDNSGFVGVGISVAADALGNPHVAYVNASTGSLIYRFHNGFSWSSVALGVVAAPAVQPSKTCIGIQGTTIHILYRDSVGLKHTYGLPGSWISEVVDTAGIQPESLSLALDSTGSPLVSYIGDGELRWGYKDGGAWTTETIEYSASGEALLYTSIAVATDDTPHIGFRVYNNTSGAGGLVYLDGSLDKDRDGMEDQWELDNGLDPTDPEDWDDYSDGDGYNNLEEYQNETDPNDEDSDDDGLWDDEEAGAGTDPNNPDCDGDGLPDGWEFDNGLNPLSDQGDNGAAGNPDGDAFNNLQEFGYGMSPQHHDGNAGDDYDGDGLTSAQEIAEQTHPYQWDTDGDKLSDGEEVNTHSTDPTDSDSDDDGLVDGAEIGYYVFWDSFEGATIDGVWTNGGDLSWAIDSTTSEHGAQSVRSGSISDGQSSQMELDVTLLGAGEVSFRYKTSTQLDHDKLLFSVDGGTPTSFSGENAWSFSIHSLEAGTSTLRWLYQKDAVSSAGDDAVWIDGVSVEVSATGTSANDDDSDNDGLLDGEEINTHGTDPLDADCDNDGLKDGEEVNDHNTDPLDADTDGDTLNDGAEIDTHLTNPLLADTDGDGMRDDWEINYGLNAIVNDAGGDPDADGLDNLGEYQADTDPGDSDSDNDLLPDGWEVANSLDPKVNDASADPDSDQLDNLGEYQADTDPNDSDTDNDLMPDGWEVTNSLDPKVNDASADPDLDQLGNLAEFQADTDPNDSDTDNDGMKDGWEVANSLDPKVNDAAADPDSDQLSNLAEFGADTDPHDNDTDNDTMPDGWEVANALNPKSDDSAGDPDNDQLNNLAEFGADTNPQIPDTDNDAMPDGWEVAHSLNPKVDDRNGDPDGDQLGNLAELQAGTDPQDSDSDNDGMPDGWEVTHSLAPMVDDSAGDPDNDGLSNLTEHGLDTDPQDADTDNDTMPDGWEVSHSLNPKIDDGSGDPDNDLLDNAGEYQFNGDPNDSDTDNDGMPDGWERSYLLILNSDDSALDPDGDNLTNLEEYGLGTSPISPDSDGDSLPDDWEIANSLDPTVHNAGGDADGDGLLDIAEFAENTDPQNPDSDGDGLNDGTEVNTLSSNPLLRDSDGDGLEDGHEVIGISTFFDSFENGTINTPPWTDTGTVPWLVNGPTASHGSKSCLLEFAPFETNGALRFESHLSTPGEFRFDINYDLNIGFDSSTYINLMNLNTEQELYSGSSPWGPGASGWQSHTVSLSRGDVDLEFSCNHGGADANTWIRIDKIELVSFATNTDPADPDSDNDGLNDLEEFTHGTDPNDEDSDGDGLLDGDEVNTHGSDPLSPDGDSDGMPDNWEVMHNLLPAVDDSAADPDADGLNNLGEYNESTHPRDDDSDNDGLNDGDEVIIYNSDPHTSDSDGDTLFDGAEVHTHGTSPTLQDTDGDTLRDDAELNTHGTLPTKADSEDDGMPDNWELDHGLLPMSNDASGDPDADLLVNVDEFTNSTDPNNPDSDGDALTDGAEVHTHNTDPALADSDGEGLSDGQEVIGWGTDPNDPDTDNDGVSDRDETEISNTNPFSTDTDGDGLSDYAEDVSTATFIDSFERLSLGSNWQTGGTVAWAPFFNLDSYDGSRAATGRNLNSGQSSFLSITRKTGNGEISFALDISGSADDTLSFYIDDVLQSSWNGSTSWMLVSFPITEGLHTFRWTWQEDLINYSWEEARVDLVRFPLASVGSDSCDPDTDDDGLNDLEEVNHGTSPTDPDSDGDGIPDGDEVNELGTDPLKSDTDDDGMPDPWEIAQGLDPLLDDSLGDYDADGLLNGQEFAHGTLANRSDTDGDGMPDGWEITYSLAPITNDADSDGDADGVEALEEFSAGSRPDLADSDGDGMPDRWEIDHGLNPASNDSGGDADSDTLTNLEEFNEGSHPQETDSDGDGLADNDEVDTHGTEPGIVDTDGDGLSDGSEIITHGTLPLDTDSDNDGLTDGLEILTYGSNPLSTDSDGDGVSDGDEVSIYGSYPANIDSDGDGLGDGQEVALGAVVVGQPLDDQNPHPAWPIGWTTGGDDSWIYSTFSGRFHAPDDMLYDESCWLEFTTTTPKGLIRFDFSMNGEDGEFIFFIDGVARSSREIAGVPTWSLPVSAGSHTFRWLYKATSAVSFADGAQLRTFQILVPGTNTDPTMGDSDGDLNADDYELDQLEDPWNPYSRVSDQYWIRSVVETGVSSVGTGLAIDSAGDLHACYQKAGVGLRFATLSSGNWSHETAKTGQINHSELILAADGTPHIVAADDAGYIYHLEKPSSTWISHQFSYAGGGNMPALALDGSGNPSVAYFHDGNDDLEVKTKNGASWSTKVVFERYFTDTGKCEEPALVIDAAGNPQVAYYVGDLQYVYPGESLMFSAWDSNGSQWVDHNLDYLACENTPVCEPTLRLDSSGNPHIAWHDRNNGSLRYARHDGSTWHFETIDADLKHLTAYVGSRPALVLDANDMPWIAYYDEQRGNLKLARKSAVGWRRSVVDSVGDVGQHCSLVVANDGRPHIIYYDATNQQIKHAVPNMTTADYSDADLDVLSAREEWDHGTDPDLADSDSDGLDDGVEVWVTRTSPTDADSDNDTLSDGDEVNTHGTNPKASDSDGDGMRDDWELDHGLDPLIDDSGLDADSDGVDNGTENSLGLLPDDIDTDNDGVPDGWEIDHGANPLIDDAGQDPDGDGLSFLDEYQLDGTVTGPDSDGDGLVNGAELHTHATDPLDPDSDDDGMPDGWEVENSLDPTIDDSAGNPDGDGLSNAEEFLWGTDPNNSDTDGDKLLDHWEIEIYGTSPFHADSDGDGISDFVEVRSVLPQGVDFSAETPQQGLMMLRGPWGPMDGGLLGSAWTTGGDANWGRVKDTYVDAPDSARSGAVDENEASWIEYQADNLTGEISFWIRTDCEAGRDSLRFSIDDELRHVWSGLQGWTYVAFAIPPGSHTFRWTYSRGAGGDTELNGAWIDSVVVANPGSGTDPNNGDSDGDNLGDGWEINNGFDPMNAADGTADADGDGLDMAAEVANGTDPDNSDSDGDGDTDGEEVNDTGLDPNDASSVFKAVIIEANAIREIVRWPCAPGRVYTVWRSTDLVNFVAVATDIPSDGEGLQSYTYNTPQGDKSFYKIEVKAAP